MPAETTHSLILSIETATPVCSVALHHNGKLVGILETFTDKSHSSGLIPMIVELLESNGTGYPELSAVAVSKGPGSYTGLRIGVSTAKGICFARNIPLIGVPTLEALALQVIRDTGNSEALYSPMLDARRMEVYTMLMDAERNVMWPESAQIIHENSFSEIPGNRPILLFGPGSGKCREVLSRRPDIIFVTGYKASASTVGEIAHDLYLQKKFENTALFEPFYLKEFRTTVPKSRL